MRQRGFTLLEVLVALLIVCTALGAALRAMGSLTQNSDGLRTNMMAVWSAENRMVQVRLAKVWPAPGKTPLNARKPISISFVKKSCTPCRTRACAASK